MHKYRLMVFTFLLALFAPMPGHAQHGAVLCELHQMSLADPMRFDGVIDANIGIFDNSMIFYIRDRVTALSARAHQHDADCEGYAYDPRLYIQCKADNLPRLFVVWLGSVLNAANGASWGNTPLGREQIGSLQFCQQTGYPMCREMQQMGVQRSLAVCPQYLG